MSGFTSVVSALAIGKIGQLAYQADANMLTRSYVLENATVVPPGRGVIYDATNDSVKLPDGAGLFEGVAWDDGTLPIETTGYEAGVNPNVPVLKRGEVWVAITQDVDPSLPVYYQQDASGAGPCGTFRADANGGKATIVSTGAQWAAVYTAAVGRAILRLNLV